MRKTRNNDEKLRVALILNDTAVWKFHSVYKAVHDSKIFEPQIWIWHPPRGSRTTVEDLEQFCIERGYSYINMTEVKEPEISKAYRLLHFLFFGLPYYWSWPPIPFSNISKNRPLHCYIPYAFNVSDLTINDYNRWFFTSLDFHFHPTNLHKSISMNQGAFPWVRDVVTGYPGIEGFARPLHAKRSGKPTLIYAPHHTISSDNSFGLSYSTFEDFGLFIRDLMLETKHSINWVFKPHPLLFTKLVAHSAWGKSKTVDYYNEWDVNAEVQEGNYDELFQIADGMIHDSGSFLAEFLATGKPAMYLKREINTQPRLNEFGFQCLEQHYIGESQSAIYVFVHDTILQGRDPKKERREDFIYSKAYGNHDISASQAIVKILEKEIRIKP